MEASLLVNCLFDCRIDLSSSASHCLRLCARACVRVWVCISAPLPQILPRIEILMFLWDTEICPTLCRLVWQDEEWKDVCFYFFVFLFMTWISLTSPQRVWCLSHPFVSLCVYCSVAVGVRVALLCSSDQSEDSDVHTSRRPHLLLVKCS